MTRKTPKECKMILSKLGFELGVSPNLISTRLLSAQDKNDMMEGKIEISSLKCLIGAWMASGMPDYAHGKTLSMKEEDWNQFNSQQCSLMLLSEKNS